MALDEMLEAGVGRALARHRAAHYRDVRYDLRFTLSVAAPSAWTIVSNTARARAESLTRDADEHAAEPLKLTTFRETEAISTYVFAFAAGPFAEFADEGSPQATRMLVRRSKREAARAESGEILRLNREGLLFFERYFERASGRDLGAWAGAWVKRRGLPVANVRRGGEVKRRSGLGRRRAVIKSSPRAPTRRARGNTLRQSLRGSGTRT